jgi:hypothetical protein
VRNNRGSIAVLLIKLCVTLMIATTVVVTVGLRQPRQGQTNANETKARPSNISGVTAPSVTPNDGNDYTDGEDSRLPWHPLPIVQKTKDAVGCIGKTKKQALELLGMPEHPRFFDYWDYSQSISYSTGEFRVDMPFNLAVYFRDKKIVSGVELNGFDIGDNAASQIGRQLPTLDQFWANFGGSQEPLVGDFEEITMRDGFGSYRHLKLIGKIGQTQVALTVQCPTSSAGLRHQLNEQTGDFEDKVVLDHSYNFGGVFVTHFEMPDRYPDFPSSKKLTLNPKTWKATYAGQ